jgi:hypothetical protein
MIRVIIVLFWIGLLVGTLVAHNVVTNWIVTFGGLYFLARWWTGRGNRSRLTSAASSATGPSTSNAMAIAATDAAPASAQSRSRWTVDRVHTREARWR